MFTKAEILDKYAEERTKCLKWSRCMGYYRPTENYNLGKQSEFNQRVWFKTLKSTRGEYSIAGRDLTNLF